MMDILQTVEKW